MISEHFLTSSTEACLRLPRGSEEPAKTCVWIEDDRAASVVLDDDDDDDDDDDVGAFFVRNRWRFLFSRTLASLRAAAAAAAAAAAEKEDEEEDAKDAIVSLLSLSLSLSLEENGAFLSDGDFKKGLTHERVKNTQTERERERERERDAF